MESLGSWNGPGGDSFQQPLPVENSVACSGTSEGRRCLDIRVPGKPWGGSRVGGWPQKLRHIEVQRDLKMR